MGRRECRCRVCMWMLERSIVPKDCLLPLARKRWRACGLCDRKRRAERDTGRTYHPPRECLRDSNLGAATEIRKLLRAGSAKARIKTRIRYPRLRNKCPTPLPLPPQRHRQPPNLHPEHHSNQSRDETPLHNKPQHRQPTSQTARLQTPPHARQTSHPQPPPTPQPIPTNAPVQPQAQQN